MTGLSINDDEAEEVVKAVASFGRETPLHVTAYYPAHRPPIPRHRRSFWRTYGGVPRKSWTTSTSATYRGAPANTPTAPVAATQSSRGWATEPWR